MAKKKKFDFEDLNEIAGLAAGMVDAFKSMKASGEEQKTDKKTKSEFDTGATNNLSASEGGLSKRRPPRELNTGALYGENSQFMQRKKNYPFGR